MEILDIIQEALDRDQVVVVEDGVGCLYRVTGTNRETGYIDVEDSHTIQHRHYKEVGQVMIVSSRYEITTKLVVPQL